MLHMHTSGGQCRAAPSDGTDDSGANAARQRFFSRPLAPYGVLCFFRLLMPCVEDNVFASQSLSGPQPSLVGTS